MAIDISLFLPKMEVIDIIPVNGEIVNKYETAHTRWVVPSSTGGGLSLILVRKVFRWWDPPFCSVRFVNSPWMMVINGTLQNHRNWRWWMMVICSEHVSTDASSIWSEGPVQHPVIFGVGISVDSTHVKYLKLRHLKHQSFRRSLVVVILHSFSINTTQHSMVDKLLLIMHDYDWALQFIAEIYRTQFSLEWHTDHRTARVPPPGRLRSPNNKATDWGLLIQNRSPKNLPLGRGTPGLLWLNGVRMAISTPLCNQQHPNNTFLKLGWAWDRDSTMIQTIISIPYDVAPITMTMFCPFESGLSSGAIDPAQRPDRDPSIELGSWPRDLGISPCLHGDLEGSWGVSLFLGCGMGWSMGRSN